MSETLKQETPETDALLRELYKGKSNTLEYPCEQQLKRLSKELEISRNRWRSVAEQAEKAFKADFEAGVAEKRSHFAKVGSYARENARLLRERAETLHKEFLAAFDSLRKEESND